MTGAITEWFEMGSHPPAGQRMLLFWAKHDAASGDWQVWRFPLAHRPHGRGVNDQLQSQVALATG
jgi:hypothetical protein